MEKIRQFLARKDVVFTLQRYGIDALGAMAQGLFCTLLVGNHPQHSGTAVRHRVFDTDHRHRGQG